jgi:hypothetical protein
MKKPEKPLTIPQFMEANHIGRQKLAATLAELGIRHVPIRMVAGNPTFILTRMTQEKLNSQLKFIAPDSIEDYYQRGYRSAVQAAQQLGIGRATVFRHLQELCPDWETRFPSVLRGKRRVTLLPPELIVKIGRYRDLGDCRKTLSIWRSMQARHAFDGYYSVEMDRFVQAHAPFLTRIFVDHDPQAISAYTILPDKVPFPTEREHGIWRANVTRWKSAEATIRTIMNAPDIIPVDKSDEEIFTQLRKLAEQSWMGLVLIHIEPLVPGILKGLPRRHSRDTVRWEEYLWQEIFNFLLQQVAALSDLPLSMIEFEDQLHQAMTKFIAELKDDQATFRHELASTPSLR